MTSVPATAAERSNIQFPPDSVRRRSEPGSPSIARHFSIGIFMVENTFNRSHGKTHIECGFDTASLPGLHAKGMIPLMNWRRSRSAGRVLLRSDEPGVIVLANSSDNVHIGESLPPIMDQLENGRFASRVDHDLLRGLPSYRPQHSLVYVLCFRCRQRRNLRDHDDDRRKKPEGFHDSDDDKSVGPDCMR